MAPEGRTGVGSGVRSVVGASWELQAKRRSPPGLSGERTGPALSGERRGVRLELQLNDDQVLFRDTTRRFLDDTCPLTEVRRLAAVPAGFDETWWRRARRWGGPRCSCPRSAGGGSVSGQGLRDLAVVAEERGRLVAPGPFVRQRGRLDPGPGRRSRPGHRRPHRRVGHRRLVPRRTGPAFGRRRGRAPGNGRRCGADGASA